MRKKLTARLVNRQLVRAGDHVTFTDSDGQASTGIVFKYKKKLRFWNREFDFKYYPSARLGKS